MLAYALGAIGVFGFALVTRPRPGGTSSAPELPTLTAPVPYAGKPSPTSTYVPPWRQNTNFLFGGDPQIAGNTAATQGPIAALSHFDPSTPEGRGNLGFFGWTDQLFAVLTGSGSASDIASLAKSGSGFA